MNIVKIGGSVLTYKSEDKLSLREDRIKTLSEEIKDIGESKELILVTGAGSIGHKLAKEYIEDGREDLENFTEAVIRFQEYLTKVWDIFSDKLNILPLRGASMFYSEEGRINYVGEKLVDKAKENLIPMVSADSILDAEGSYRVLSGDEIMKILSRAHGPEKSVFLCDVDGIKIDGEIRSVLRAKEGYGKEVKGGMRIKLENAREIASSGIPCYIVNGLKEGNLEEILIRGNDIGTKILK